MTEEPIAIREMTRDEALDHYRWLVNHVALVRKEYDGVLNRAGRRLLTRSHLAARVALTRVQEGRG